MNDDTRYSRSPEESRHKDDASSEQRNALEALMDRIQVATDKQSKTAWLLGGVTLAFGVALLLAAHYPYTGDWIPELVTEIGSSFVIAAMVGIFYDVFNKRAGRTREKLIMEENIKSLVKVGERVEGLLKQLEMSNDPLGKIKATLEQHLAPTGEYRPIIAGLDRFLEDIFAIREIRNEVEVEEGREYLHCVGWVLEKYTVQAAAQARTVLEGMQASGTMVLQHAFFPPERRVLTLEVMAAQLRSLRCHDSYDSLANIWLYVDMPREFIGSVHAALDQGATIRRIFNMCRDQVGDEASLNKAIHLTESHVKTFKDDNFDYRYLKESTLASLDPEILRAAGVGDVDQLRLTYFAHFNHEKEEKSLRFEPSFHGADMLGVALKVYSMGIHDFECQAKVALFEHIWEKCDREPPAVGNAAYRPPVPASSGAGELRPNAW